MITVYLCDDDIEIIESYSALIKRYSKARMLELKLETFHRGEDLLFHLDGFTDAPDIILLDIYMDALNGIETAKRIRERNVDAQIIFLTTSSEFVFDAFDVRSFNYLVKQDTSDARFEEVFNNAISLVEKKATDFFDCSFGSESRRIALKDISHFEIYRRVMRVHYNTNETFDFYETMDSLTEKLAGKGFVRVHRSYLVNLKHIVMFKNQTIRLSNAEELPLGKAYQVSVKDAFNAFVSDSWDA
ncbi:LytR/AlgR family response regulator transcription factor [Erysipelothrix aquatica]|uniref:LytR/AlgR family response regulator transcription factor n=1 Tax=Erysipelothrix aquatica TaxID=2683714 RepID=UPI00135A330F|nr:LytTR family DNA-binding domain-containing protein [Erysipelothrix aquatica]